MSSTQSAQPGHQPSRSAGLTLNLSSNNPFRNRAASPLLPGATYINTTSPASPFDDPPPRPVSRNPFLDPSYSSSQPNLIGHGTMAPTLDSKASPTAEELFDGLSINDKKPSRPDGNRPPTNRPPGPPGRDNMPPPGRRGPPPPGHRPSRSQEEAMRQRRMQGNGNNSVSSGAPRPAGPPGSPQRRPQERRPRRNSESSLLIDFEKPLTEEEKKAKEAKRRERERRTRESKEKDPKKPSRKIDIIDQLDATSIYGTGLSVFHHDGPFDAVNPHRNRKGSRRAPMQAFAKDSLNMSLGGSGPLNKRPDHATFMGNNDGDASADYNYAAIGAREKKDEPAVFDPRNRGSILHGEESMGLGTSTFLEGTPAARTAIQRREAEQAQQMASEGLKRNKSIAQRIRGIKREPREYGPSGRTTNPEGTYHRRSPDSYGPSTSVSYTGERNPFFSEFGKEPENISVRRTDGKTRSPGTPPPVPRRGSANGLERRATSDVTSPTEDGSAKPAGFLARVKSLKGGRRRQASDAMAPPAPGTAA